MLPMLLLVRHQEKMGVGTRFIASHGWMGVGTRFIASHGVDGRSTRDVAGMCLSTPPLGRDKSGPYSGASLLNVTPIG